jgi:hypothetical protein
MPLSAPAERHLLHCRDIQLRGWQRVDGQFDIEAHLTDIKTAEHGRSDAGRVIGPGDAIHDMWLRLTVSEDMVVTACEAAMDATPYAPCTGAAPNFAALAGVKVGPGFNRAVQERVGGIAGCTHLRELLAQMATVVFQTLYPIRRARELAEAARRAGGGGELVPHGKPSLLGTCIAYAPDSPVSRVRWPWMTPKGAE